jgi:hypothetical protein
LKLCFAFQQRLRREICVTCCLRHWW